MFGFSRIEPDFHHPFCLTHLHVAIMSSEVLIIDYLVHCNWFFILHTFLGSIVQSVKNYTMSLQITAKFSADRIIKDERTLEQFGLSVSIPLQASE